MKIEVFDFFKKIFNENNYRLFMIGSTSRDFILNIQPNDYDFVTDALPNDVIKILKDFNPLSNFKKYGIISLKFSNYKIDIATLRKESNYLDSRHPNFIEFVKDINIDCKRRDFTINCIYIDENYKIIDPFNGVNDLLNHKLVMIGDADTRIKEDPLRILRAERFIKKYNLQPELSLKNALINNKNLIKKLNPNKVKQEEQKLNNL